MLCLSLLLFYDFVNANFRDDKSLIWLSCYNELGNRMLTARLIMAIISTLLQEIALFVIWRWGLPEVGIFLPLYVLIIVMILWGAYATITFWVVTKALKRKELVGLPAMVGGRGRVVSQLTPEGQVMVSGELWGAKSVEGNIEQGEEVLVVGQDGLKLFVRQIKPGD